MLAINAHLTAEPSVSRRVRPLGLWPVKVTAVARLCRVLVPNACMGTDSHS